MLSMPKLITHEDLEARRACVPKVEAKLVVNVDARDYIHVSYFVGVKVICIVGLAGDIDVLGGVQLRAVEENIARIHLGFPYFV